MFDPDLNYWFNNLSALNDAERSEIERKDRTPTKRKSNRLLVLLFFGPLGLAFIFAGVVWAGAPKEVAWLSLASLAISYVGLFLYPLFAFRLHRESVTEAVKNPFSIILKNVRVMAEIDRSFIQSFSEKPTEEIRFILAELKAEKSFFERRLGLLVGAIERVGIFPGVLALAVVISRLGSNQPEWVYTLAYAMPVLYGFGLICHFLLMRLERMITVLETVAEWQESSNPYEPSRNHI